MFFKFRKSSKKDEKVPKLKIKKNEGEDKKELTPRTLSRREKRIQEIESSLEKWKENEKKGILSEDWLENKNDLTFNKKQFSLTLKVDLDFTETFQNASLVIPESYPKGEYYFSMGSDTKLLKGQSLYEVLKNIFKEWKKIREQTLKELATPTPLTGNNQLNDSIFDTVPSDNDEMMEEDLMDEDDDFDDDDEMLLEEDDSPTGFGELTMDVEEQEAQKKVIHDLVKEINTYNKFGYFAKAGAISKETIKIYLYLDPKRLEISAAVANCWRIDPKKYIIVALTFSGFLFEGSQSPKVECYQNGDTRKSPIRNVSSPDEKSNHGLAWTCCERIKKEFFPKNPIDKLGRIKPKKENKISTSWKKKGHETNFFLQLIIFVEKKIKTSPYNCIVCGNPMEHIGIKPTVCSSPLCIFSHEEYSLGTDIEAEILSNGDIVDLLFSLTVSAAAAPLNRGFNPFSPFPLNLEAKEKLGNSIVTHNFLGHDGKQDNRKVLQVCNKIPKIETLQKWIKKQKLKENLNKIDKRAYGLIRWIVTSNRTHLHKLKNNQKIQAMKTEHQYFLMSGTPEKEREFQTLKQKYGTIFAFHGSPAYSWHNILRNGLISMSGTKGQLNGAAHGKGVYLAKDSQTSFGYARFHQGWANSQYSCSQLGIMALCEIVNHPNYKAMPNPYYVIPDEKHIQTRLFFIFNNRTSGNCIAKQITLPNVDLWRE